MALRGKGEGIVPLEEAPPAQRLADIDPASKLTRKQLMFIKYFFETDMDPAKSVILAGFQSRDPAMYADQLLSNPLISSIIFQRIRRLGEKTDINLEMLQEKLLAEAEREGEGANHNARVSALSTLVRMNGGFERGRGEKTPVAINMDFGDLSEEEEEHAGGQERKKVGDRLGESDIQDEEER